MNVHNIEYVFLGEEFDARSKDPSCYVEGKVIYQKIADSTLFKNGLEHIKLGMQKDYVLFDVGGNGTVNKGKGDNIMRKLDKLRKVARDCAKWRGHELSRFSPAKIQSNGKQESYASCLICGAMAVVDTQPLPNGIDISGSAVAINCKLKT